jgi:DNA-binding HxlR family transcriptional regulator
MARDAGLVKAFRDASEACPIPEAVALIGERWTCLIIRAAMLGLRHFEEFQRCLGIARNILSDRLGRLVDAQILARNPDPDDRRRVIYTLTERGETLLPVIIALRQWASNNGMGEPTHHQVADRRDRRPLAPIAVRSHDGRTLALADLVWLGPDGEEIRLLSHAEEEFEAA